jgi:mRNA interferase RelE/StbE
VYAVHLTRRAQKDLLAIPKAEARRIRAALNNLAAEENPAAAVKKLKGHEQVPLYSLRIGRYRALLVIENGVLVIFVITIDHRGTVYRGM